MTFVCVARCINEEQYCRKSVLHVVKIDTAYRRKIFSRLLRLGIECFAVLLSGIGGGTRLVLVFLLNLDRIGSDCLWLMALLVGSAEGVSWRPFSFTAIPESSGPGLGSGGVTVLPLALALEVLRESVMLLFALETPDRRELLVTARFMPVSSA